MHMPYFSMRLETPETLAACDICTQFCPIGEQRIRTYVGDSPQSDVCMDCANAIKRLKRPDMRVPVDTTAEAVV